MVCTSGRRRRMGLTGLEDQQPAGLIMWIPGGLLYTAAALALAGLWITQTGQRRRLSDTGALTR